MDLDSLNAELIMVVRKTIQAERVSLWLRPDTIAQHEPPDWHHLIPPTSWKVYSVNFVLTAFFEARLALRAVASCACGGGTWLRSE